MAARNFDRAFALTLRHEGGYVDHPSDPGGATNLGITIGTLSDWLGRPATKAEVAALTPAQVKPIYRRNYWDAIGADGMEPGFDYACYDFAVNSGPGRAIRYSKNIQGASPEDRIRNLCTLRLAFLKSLPIWPAFGRGWSKRVAEVQAVALTMARAHPPPPDMRETTPKAPSAGLFSWLGSIFKQKKGKSTDEVPQSPF
jgi:lysozyme family protein